MEDNETVRLPEKIIRILEDIYKDTFSAVRVYRWGSIRLVQRSSWSPTRLRVIPTSFQYIPGNHHVHCT